MIKFIYILLLIITSTSIFSQPITWQKSYNFPEDRTATACLETFNGNYLLAGEIFQIPRLQIYIINKWGDIILTKEFFVPRMKSILQLPDSSFIMAGGFGIFKLTKNLDSVWFKTYGWIDYEKIIRLPDNNFIACGWRGPQYNFGHIVKFNLNGDTLWTKNIDSSTNMFDIRFYDIEYINENSIYIAGSITITSAMGDAVLYKINTNGEILFSKRYYSQADERLRRLVYYDNSLFMIGAVFFDSCFVLKTDINGNFIFLKYYYETTLFGVLNIGNHLILSGWSHSPEQYPTTRKLDLDGNEIWHHTIYNSWYQINPNDFILINDNSLLLTGSQYDSLYDKNTIYLLRTDSNFSIEPNGIKENQNVVNNFDLYQNYPNPFNNETQVKITISKKNVYVLDLFDIEGKLIKNIFNKFFNPGNFTISINYDINKCSSGIYFLRLSDGNIQQSIKLIYLK